MNSGISPPSEYLKSSQEDRRRPWPREIPRRSWDQGRSIPHGLRAWIAVPQRARYPKASLPPRRPSRDIPHGNNAIEEELAARPVFHPGTRKHPSPASQGDMEMGLKLLEDAISGSSEKILENSGFRSKLISTKAWNSFLPNSRTRNDFPTCLAPRSSSGLRGGAFLPFE